MICQAELGWFAALMRNPFNLIASPAKARHRGAYSMGLPSERFAERLQRSALAIQKVGEFCEFGTDSWWVEVSHDLPPVYLDAVIRVPLRQARQISQAKSFQNIVTRTNAQITTEVEWRLGKAGSRAKEDISPAA